MVMSRSLRNIVLRLKQSMQQREHKEEAREEHEMVEKTVSPLYDSPHCNKNAHQNPNRVQLELF